MIAFVFAFLFTTVAALATAMTGNNPISGMTLVTLIVGSSALVAVGLQGEFGKYAAIVMGAVVCTSLAMAGGFVTDLKVGYWLGSTPRYQQLSKVIGTLFAAVGVALTVLLIHRAYGHTDPATGQFITGFLDSPGCRRRRPTCSPPSCPASSTTRRSPGCSTASAWCSRSCCS